MMITEESDQISANKDQIVATMQRRLNLQNEEIKRRQQVIERLEFELLREKRFKHLEHICENCN